MNDGVMADDEHVEQEPEITFTSGAVPTDATPPPVVTMDASVREWIDTYARGGTDRERGGMLLGRITQVDGIPHVTVEAAVEAVGAEERRASITFTHQTWEHINAVRESQYPHLRIIGWFHTHPGYGVFLSGFDLFIHRNFFNLPWQVAYVVDPVQGDAGFFVWQQEEINRLPSFEEAMPVAVPVPATSEPVLVVEVLPAPRRRGPVWAFAIIGIIALVSIGMWTLPGYLRALRHSRIVIAPSQPVTPPKVAVSPPTPAPTPPIAPSPSIQYYVKMKSGDTLWDMAHKYLGSPLRYPELQELNKIENPKRISSGTIIAVPGKSAPEAQPKGDTGDG